MGTIVYVKDEYEIMISQEEFANLKEPLRSIIDKYSYIDPEGYRIVSWDIAKYTNHCCDPNTISTGYGFEIAIRDIEPGEQITDEYGIFNLEHTLSLFCDNPLCRKEVKPEDFDLLYEEWDRKIIPALKRIPYVAQPLYSLLDKNTVSELEDFFRDNSLYKSVYNLKYKKPVKV